MTKCYTCEERRELTKKIEALFTNDEAAEFERIHNQIIKPSFLYSASTLVDSIAYLSQNRDRRSRENNLLTRTCICIIESNFKRFDEVGLDEFLSKVGPKFLALDLDKISPILYEESRLAHNASIFPEEMEALLANVEKNKDVLSQKLKKGTVHFSDYRFSTVMGYLGPGASWGDFFEGIIGAALVVVNLASTAVTGPLLWASVVVGIAGVVDACS